MSGMAEAMARLGELCDQLNGGLWCPGVCDVCDHTAPIADVVDNAPGGQGLFLCFSCWNACSAELMPTADILAWARARKANQ